MISLPRSFCMLMAVLVSIASMSFFPAVAQVCPTITDDGGPYATNEGEGIQFNATVNDGGAPLTQFQWFFGNCLLGNGTGLFADRLGGNGLQNCLFNQIGTDGNNQTYPNGINYFADNGSCQVTGSVDLQFDNSLPIPNISTTCPTPLTGTVNIDFTVFDPSLSDHPLNIALDGSTGGSPFPITGTTIGTGGTGSLPVDTTLLPDADNFTFELIAQDNQGPANDQLNGCVIDNNPPSLPSQNLNHDFGDDLTIDLTAATDDGVGLDQFQAQYDSTLVGTATGGAGSITIDRGDLFAAGVTICDDAGELFTGLDLTAIDGIGQSVTTNFPLTVFCVENTEIPGGGSTAITPTSTTSSTSTGTPSSTGDIPTTGGDQGIGQNDTDQGENDDPSEQLGANLGQHTQQLPQFVPNFDLPPAQRIQQFRQFCVELPPVCPHDRPGQPVDLFADMAGHRSVGYVDAYRASCGVKGKGQSGKFFPDDLVTNGEAVKMATTALPFNPVYAHGGELTYDGPTFFLDVPVTEWSAPYRANAHQHGRLEGITTPGQLAHPSQPMSRSDAIRLLLNIYTELTSLDLSQFSTRAFEDISPSHPDFRQISAAYALDLVQGNLIDGERLFRPDAGITRAEYAKIATQLLAPLFNRCGATANLDRLSELIDQRSTLDHNQQDEALDEVKRIIHSADTQQLELEGIAHAGLTHTLARTTKDDTTTLLNQADQLLNEFGTVSRDGPCPPELLAQLLAQKAALEAQVAQLESEQDATTDKIDELKKQIDDLENEISDLEQQKQVKDQEVKDKQGEIDDLDDKIDDLDQQLEDSRERVDELQDLLTNGDDVTEHKGDKPLDAIAAGAAVSFNGGASRVVAHGEGGVETLLEATENGQSVMSELRDLQSKIRDLTKQKEQATKDKETKQDELDKAKDEQQEIDDKLTDKQDQLDTKQDELKDCQDKLKDIGQKIAALNAKINAFNAKAAECGIQAKKAYQAAQEKLRNMPDEDKETAEELFEDSLDEDEEEALTHPDQDVAGGGGGLSGATGKLEDAMRAASACPPPELKTGPWTMTAGSYHGETIWGAESIEVTNAKGTRGLDDETMEEIFADIMKGLNFVDAADKSMGLYELLADANPVSLIYSIFQDSAQEAITSKLKEWMDNRTLQGLPERIEVTIGPIWSLPISGREEQQPVYQCIDGIRQYSHSNHKQIEQVGECKDEGGPFTYRQTFTEADLNLQGCTLGNCPQAREQAIKDTINAALKKHANGGILGTCEQVASALGG